MSKHLSPAQLSAYVDGECAAAEQAQVAAHLEACPQCEAEHAALQHVEQALTLLATPEPAPDLLFDLRRRLATPPARSWRWAWRVAAAAAAAGVILLWPRTSPPRTGTTLANARPKATAVAPREVKQPVLAEVKTPVRPPRPAVQQERTRLRPQLAAVTPESRLVVSHRGYDRSPGPKAAPKSPEGARYDSPGRSPGWGGPREGSPEGATQAQRVAAAQAALRATPPRAQGGIILILGDPQPVPASNECHLEVSRPDGTRSVFTQTQSRDRTGQVRTARVSLQNYAAGER